MSYWTQYNFEQEIHVILSNCVYKNPSHHLGRPFLSPYQIAIQFDINNPGVVAGMGLQIGGKGLNEKTSLAQYIARELSTRIKNGIITDIEGGFISNQHLHEISFDYNDNIIVSSATGGDSDLSVFRLRD